MSYQTEVMTAWKFQSKKNSYERDPCKILVCYVYGTESLNFKATLRPFRERKWIKWFIITTINVSFFQNFDYQKMHSFTEPLRKMGAQYSTLLFIYSLFVETPILTLHYPASASLVEKKSLELRMLWALVYDRPILLRLSRYLLSINPEIGWANRAWLITAKSIGNWE